jgi:hypothetical protein
VEDILTMSQKELKRLHVIRKAIEKRLKQREAAGLLDLSERQIRRLVWRIRQESDKGIIHRLRGRQSHRAIAIGIKQKAISLCKTKYTGFNPTFASEKLFERDKIRISRETLRQWFIAGGIAYQKRKARPHRKWRQRKAHCGEMLQMDGSHHGWFEDRGPECVLMGYIDDASSRVYARFYDYEGTLPAMDGFRGYCLKYGLPLDVYLDRHTTYKAKDKQTIADELANRASLSQFGRALEELGVHLIHAQSAPAKGRVERLFKTFQDRLIKEMRLKNIGSIAAGNEFLKTYLPVFNKRFSVEPLSPEDLHRPLPKGVDLDRIFSVRTTRALRNDFTVAYECKLYQVEDNVRAKEIILEESIDGSLLITHNGRLLRYHEITQRPAKIKLPRKHREYFPVPKDHPWRSFKLPGSLNFEAKEEAFADAL